MSEYVLTCCSTADMPLSFFQERDIPFVSFHFMMDGIEYADDLGQSMPFDEFYQRIKDGAMPTTSQVNVEQFKEFFEPFLQKGQDILHVSLSTGLSGAYNSARSAAQELMQKYTDRKILIVDSLGASSGYGLLMDTAWEKRRDGMTIQEL